MLCDITNWNNLRVQLVFCSTSKFTYFFISKLDHYLFPFIIPMNGPLVTWLETAIILAVKGNPEWII